jgi:iron complex transport system substrate-binding protein
LKQSAVAVIEDSWSAQTKQILAAKPDLVMTSVPYRMESLAEIMKAGVPCLCLAPKTLSDVFLDVLHIARIMGAEHRGLALVTRMEEEIGRVRRMTTELMRPRVYCEEWGKPLIHSQLWVAELVRAAGGEFVGQPGKQVTQEEVAKANPDVIIAAWCGAGDRVPLEKLAARRGWHETRAVREGRVYCIKDEFLNTPASTLLQGLRALCAAIHPELFGEAAGLRRLTSAENAQHAKEA